MPENTTGTATSRAGTIRTATRKATKARLAMSGPSGAGKTWTALCIAEVLAPGGRYVLIDTEPSDDNNTAAELYADRFSFDVIDWTDPPFDPRDLTLTVKDLGNAGETDVLIVDSASPFWRGEGGSLDIADGRFGGWQTATPAQNAMVEAILKAPFHVIFCTRAKQAYAVEQQGEKQTVRKLGLAPIQRDDIEYEFQVVAMIDVEHRIDIGKTRCADLAGLSFHANQQFTLAQTYKAWLDRGLELITQTDADLLRQALAGLPTQDERNEARRSFKEAFGSVDAMEVGTLDAAWAHVSSVTGIDPHPYTPMAHDPATCAECELGRRARWHVGLAAPRAVERPALRADPDATDESAQEPVGGSGPAEGQEAPTERTKEAETPTEALPDSPTVVEDLERGLAAYRDFIGGKEADDLDPEMRPFEPPTAPPETSGSALPGLAQSALAREQLAKVERRQKFERSVREMTVTQVRHALEGARQPSTGPALTVRDRLVEHFLSQAMAADAFQAKGE